MNVSGVNINGFPVKSTRTRVYVPNVRVLTGTSRDGQSKRRRHNRLSRLGTLQLTGYVNYSLTGYPDESSCPLKFTKLAINSWSKYFYWSRAILSTLSARKSRRL